MKKTMSLVLLILFTTLSGYAGEKGGNGGDGYITANGNLYLLDLIEANVHENPYFEPSGEYEEETIERLKNAIPFLEENPAILLARKLKELESYSPLFSNLLIAGIEMFSWIPGSLDLLDIKDEESVFSISDPSKLRQLATRIDERIHLSSVHWENLDDANKVALILHEVVYAWVTPTSKCSKDKVWVCYLRQSSPEARLIIGHIFSENLKRRGKFGLYKLLEPLNYFRTLKVQTDYVYSYESFNFYKFLKKSVQLAIYWDTRDESIWDRPNDRDCFYNDCGWHLDSRLLSTMTSKQELMKNIEKICNKNLPDLRNRLARHDIRIDVNHVETGLEVKFLQYETFYKGEYYNNKYLSLVSTAQEIISKTIPVKRNDILDSDGNTNTHECKTNLVNAVNKLN